MVKKKINKNKFKKSISVNLFNIPYHELTIIISSSSSDLVSREYDDDDDDYGLHCIPCHKYENGKTYTFNPFSAKQFIITTIVCFFSSVQNLPPFCGPISFKTPLLD